MNRSWLPPQPPRASPAWIIASLLVHAAVGASLLLISGKTARDGAVRYIVLDDGGPGPVQYDMTYIPGGGGGAGDVVGTGGPRPQAPRPAAGPEEPGEGEIVFPVRPDTVLPAETAEPTGLGVGPGRRILGAEYGDGRVWFRPLDAIAAAIAGAGDAEGGDTTSHIARIDSAISARIMAFLDTLPPDSMAPAVPQPWVTEVGGQKWGIDQGWIYLGNLKLPTAILALLPLPQGNYEQAQRAAELQRIRLDILQAARRAESAAEFRRYVEETRRRRDAEREAQRAAEGKTKPDSIKS